MNEKENLSVTKQIEKNNDKPTRNPISVFVYALKAPETRRQYHRRLKVFLNFLDLGTDVLEDQARIFLSKAKEDSAWAQGSFMEFIGFQKDRVQRGEISDSTILNYPPTLVWLGLQG